MNMLPSNDEMYMIIIRAIKLLGGSGTYHGIKEKTIEVAKISNNALKILHREDDEGYEYEFRYKSGIKFLERIKLICNGKSDNWSFDNDDIWSISNVNLISGISKNKEKDILKAAISDTCKKEITGKDIFIVNRIKREIYLEVEKQIWIGKLLEILHEISDDAFERLTAKLFTSMGYIDIKVRKRPDNGVDGDGLRPGADVFFRKRFFFQCKRYSYNHGVSSKEIQSFRGAIDNDSPYGIFITTSYFTEPANKEASRGGRIPIELIDGHQLCEKLLEYKIGVGHTIELCEPYFSSF